MQLMHNYIIILIIMIISIFCDSLFAEENYFKIKGIKYRMGRDHNGVAIEKTNNSGFFDIYLLPNLDLISKL